MLRSEQIEHEIKEHEKEIYAHNCDINALKRELNETPETKIKRILSRMYSGCIDISSHNDYTLRNEFYVNLRNAKRTNVNGSDVLSTTETRALKEIGLMVTCVGAHYFYIDKI
jgi:hypothetical protein